MKQLLLIMFFLISLQIEAQVNFGNYFTENSLRVDLVFAGNSDSETIYLDQLRKEPYWGGTKTNLLDEFNYGEYKYELYDSQSGDLIFSKGFCTLFEEWQTTNESKFVTKSFYETLTMPFPKNKVLFKLYSRNWNGNFEQVYELNINPKDYFINTEVRDYEFVKLLDNGNPSEKVDLVFLAEGYTKEEMDKFEQDSKRVLDFLFCQKPFDQYKDYFNIWIVKSNSKESGTDIPGKRVYKKTVLNSNFYTFDSERYLTTLDYYKVRDVASVVPYDDICILVNSNKYGGGGIYNHYCISTVNHDLSEKVFVHEFGHSFAGLGDEYYNSSTSYNDFYNLEIEPWQPNLTTLVDFDRKWKDKLGPNTPLPTPRSEEYSNIIGVYEGGGYVNKGMYSPFIDCRMKSNVAEQFCPICQDAIIKKILSKTK